MGHRDVMQVCLNGHQITDCYNRNRQFRKDFCDKCGEETITSCPECNAHIRGRVIGEFIDGFKEPVPEYCHNCGEPYPWTERKTKIKEITQSNEQLQNIQIPVVDKFIEVTWLPDDFYKRLVDEINCLYINQLPMSLSILIRKLLENLIIDILRKKYGTCDLQLYYDSSRGRFHDFSVLLKNLDSKKEEFHYITPNLDKSSIQRINKYRKAGNSGAHSIDVNLTIDQISKDKVDINYSVQFLLRILQNI